MRNPLFLSLLSFVILSALLTPSESAAVPTITASEPNRDAVIELWCVAKNNAKDSILQFALDWACSDGHADCAAIQQGSACYEPEDVQSHASYAFNDYFLHNGLTQQSCDFGGSAALTSINPSRGSCKFPSSLSVQNGSVSVGGNVIGVPTTGVYYSGSTGSRIQLFSPFIIAITVTAVLINQLSESSLS